MTGRARAKSLACDHLIFLHGCTLSLQATGSERKSHGTFPRAKEHSDDGDQLVIARRHRCGACATLSCTALKTASKSLHAFAHTVFLEFSGQVLPAPRRRRAAQQSCQDTTSHLLTTSQLQSSRHASCRHHSSCYDQRRRHLARQGPVCNVTITMSASTHCAAADLLSSHRIMVRRRVRDLSA